MVRPVQVVGAGRFAAGRLHQPHRAGGRAGGATAAGAEVELISVRDLGLPLYTAEHAIPAGAHEFADTVYRC